jgi:hypothetical protein
MGERDQSSDHQRIDALERRLYRLERHVGLEPMPLLDDVGAARAAKTISPLSVASAPPIQEPPKPATTNPPVREGPAASQSPVHKDGAPLATWLKEQTEARRVPPAVSVASTGRVPSEAPPMVARITELPQRRTPTPPERKASGVDSVETAIGVKWLAIAGALGVIIGLVIFLKYAIDQGWIGHLPSWVKVFSGATFGAALMGLGELARRKINALASVGLFSAGIASAYVSVYAGYAVYAPPVFGQVAAFIMLAAISALGVLISTRTRLSVVSVVSLVGAYLAPMLLHSEHANPVVFPLYSLVLLCTGMILAAQLRGGFIWAGRLTWWATIIVGGLWCMGQLRTSPVLVLGYVGMVWSVIHAAGHYGTRGESDPEAHDTPPKAGAIAPFDLLLPMSSFAVTCWTTLLALGALHRGLALPMWLAPAAGTGVTLLLSHVLVGHVRVMTDKPRTGRQRLGASLMMQSAGLLIATVGLATSSAGPMAGVIWLVMGLAAMAGARWIESRALSAYAIVLMVIGTLRIALFDSWASRLFASPVDLLGLKLAPWTGWMAIVACAWLAAAGMRLLRREKGTSVVASGVVCAAIGVLTLMAGLWHYDSAAVAVTIAWLVVGVLACVGGWGMPRLGLRAIGVAALALTTAKLIGIDTLTSDMFKHAHEFVGLRIGTWMYAALAAGGAWMLAAATYRFGPDGQPGTGAAAACASVGLALGALSLVHPDVSVLALAGAWGAMAIAACVIGHLTRGVAMPKFGTILLSVAGVAWIGVSLSNMLEGRHGLGLLAPEFASGLMIALGLWLLPTRVLTKGDAWITLAKVCAFAAPVVLLACTTLEAAQIGRELAGDSKGELAAVSIWWGVFASGLIAWGFARKTALARHFGLALLAATALKVVLFDLAEASSLARVASFMVVGLLMLGVAAGYAKVTSKLAKAGASEPRDNAPTGDA